MRTFEASEFKAKCLAILEKVDRTGEPVTILMRGRPVARLVPAARAAGKFPQDSLAGTVEIVGDILEPALPAETWEVLRGPKRQAPKSRVF